TIGRLRAGADGDGIVAAGVRAAAHGNGIDTARLRGGSGRVDLDKCGTCQRFVGGGLRGERRRLRHVSVELGLYRLGARLIGSRLGIDRIGEGLVGTRLRGGGIVDARQGVHLRLAGLGAGLVGGGPCRDGIRESIVGARLRQRCLGVCLIGHCLGGGYASGVGDHASVRGIGRRLRASCFRSGDIRRRLSRRRVCQRGIGGGLCRGRVGNRRVGG